MMVERSAHVLVVDDDETVADVVLTYVRRAEMRADHAADGFDALRAVRAAVEAGDPYDVVVLDVMLPGIDGLEVCRRLRAERIDVPIIMLTARGEEEQRVLGLELGADDYVAKPFSPRELVLRLAAVLRRTAHAGAATEVREGTVTDGALIVELAARRATLHGEQLALTTREFDLLAFLATHQGRAYTREELMTRVWGWEFGDLSTVTVHVRRLRLKLEANPSYPVRLVTVWGVGYRWDPSDAPVPAGDRP